MNANTYSRIGQLIDEIKRDKSNIDVANERINNNLTRLNSLLKKNGQEEFELSDIGEPSGRFKRYLDDDELF